MKSLFHFSDCLFHIINLSQARACRLVRHYGLEIGCELLQGGAWKPSMISCEDHLAVVSFLNRSL